jgi:uncharacterized membrane protein HdeD (DUF308 family)
MRIFRQLKDFERFEMSWHRLLLQGIVILCLGFILALASALQPEAVVMSAQYFSWLPVCGMIILSLGLLECLDAFLAVQQRDFFQNLQVGALDMVVGGLIILSVSHSPALLCPMIAAFLLVRGLVRISLAFVLKLPYQLITLVCGIISILTGILIWEIQPAVEGWLLSLCLSIEIMFRGWAMMDFAFWVRTQKVTVS